MVSQAIWEQAEANRQPVDYNAIKNESDVHSSENGSSQNHEGRKLRPLKAVRFSEIEAKPVEWLWNPFLARGTFNLMEGEEGLGKTFLTCAFATAIASGKGLPGVPEDEHIEASNVLLISAEDSLSHVLKPRLESMNADCEKIIAVDEPFTLDTEGIFRLKMVLAEYEPRAVFIDPLFSYTGKVNLDRDSDIRTITDALKNIAETFDCCIVGIRHIGKSKGFGDARNAGLNGIGWRASARSVLLIGKNPENEFQKALCQTKNNLAPKYQKSIGFEIKESQFFWTGESGLTAETMLSQLRNDTGEERGEKQDAISFLKTVLSDGEKLVSEIEIERKQAGISEKTLQRAKSALNVKSRKEDVKNGKWLWYIPEDGQKDVEGGQINNVDHLQSNHSNKTSCSNKLAEDGQDISFDYLQPENDRLQLAYSKNPTNLENPNSQKCDCGLPLEFIDGDETGFCPIGCETERSQ